MEPIAARYEFRIWGEELDTTIALMRSISTAGATRESVETYLPSRASRAVNTKLRSDLLDVKTLEQTQNGFEQWTPRLKTGFPVSSATLREELFPLWRLESPRLQRTAYTERQLIDEVVDAHDDLESITVEKRRHALTLDGCIAEVAEVVIGQRALQTAAIESADIDALRSAVTRAGLERAQNTSYPQIISATLGWTGTDPTSQTPGQAGSWL
jgi:hypothetical protein